MVSPPASPPGREIPPTDAEVASTPGPERGWSLFLKPKPLLALLSAAFSEWRKDNAPRMGAALAYYTLFSLAPLLVIAIAIAGLFFGVQAAEGEVTGQIAGLVGQDGARAIQTIIQSVHKPIHGAVASVIGLLALLLGASGAFCEMEDALNTIWHVKPEGRSPIRNLVKERLLSFAMVMGIGFLLLVSLLLSAVLAALTKYVGGMVPFSAALLESIDFLVSAFCIALLFALIFKLLPKVAVAWSDVWIGAVFTSLLFTVGKFGIGFYIGKSVVASAYGAAGSLVIVVAWIYYSALILYFGAEFTRIYANRVGSRRNA